MNTRRKFILCALILLVSLPAYAIDYVPGDVLVVLKPYASQSRVTASSLNGMGIEALRTASFAASSGAWVKETYPALSEVGNSVYALIHSEIKSPEELTNELLENPEVLAASPNYIFHAATVPNDSFIDLCWGLDFINANYAWDYTTGSNTVYVAVLDSGIDDTNPDLTDNVATEYGANTISSSSNSARDDYGHGSHVAGIIGAIGNNSRGIAGVNWNVKLISVKALDYTGNGSFADVISALNYVTDLINQGVNIKAVNISFETYLPTKPTHDNFVRMPFWRALKALDELNKAVIVVAAGNYNAVIGEPTKTTKYDSSGYLIYRPGYYVYPPSFKGLNNMISVSAIDTDGSLASFTNTGADISAPGVNILSTWRQSVARYVQSDGTSLNVARGTSMAAPFVTGAAALLASAKPDNTAYQLKRAILDGSTNNILDLRAALNYQESNAYIPQESTEWLEYDDYAQYDSQDDSSQQTNYNQELNYHHEDKNTSGDCNGGALNILAFMLTLPLVKKFMS